MTLRSNFEPGTTRWAVRRSQWLAMGLSEADLEKPKVAVVNSSSQLSVCYQHLDAVSALVQKAIRAAGGVPFEIRTVAPSDFITSAGRNARYLMPSRDLLVNDIEVQVEGAELDGMVLLASCDKTAPAQLMAAGRLNIPSILVACGYQQGGRCGGRTVDIEDVYESVGKVKAGRMSLDELKSMTCTAITGPGVCAGLGTANSMHIIAEALGMTLPGNAPIRAGSERLDEVAAEAGQQILEMISKDLRPRQIMTPGAFRNAVSVALAIGASVNCVRHLTAIAAEAEVDVNILDLIDECGLDIPQLTSVRPNGAARIEDLDEAGGCCSVMSALRSRLDLSAIGVTGMTQEQNLAHVPAPDGNIVRPLSNPARPDPGLIVVRGNVAPIGAIAKLSAVPEHARQFSGRAKVFEQEADAIAGLQDKSIVKGDVIVLRGMGPLGGPGTVFAASFMAALVGAGLGGSVAVLTDGELSGLNSGITIGQIMPESAEGGPLAIVQDGDLIEIDLGAKRVTLAIADDDFDQRMISLPVVEPKLPKGWLGQYRRLVRPLSEGAVLG